ncbi:ABC transporter permease [Paenibacillus sp. GP183]|uniref:ABC transporter permease n=1 Tax=Paenibacillus sp. GP183 TaxID=1882751 RepID=UPI0008969316|nr:ABC transporter permease [Paenibacillus sp. GP183]SEC82725.1 peptide/nickel transport system permease protein [Paenibacillus sp. GP183]
MASYIGRRLLSFIPVALILIVFTFSLIHLTPGNPAYTILGDQASKENVKLLEAKLGLDQPLTVQFFHYVSNTLRGDFGNSLFGGQPVINLILTRIPITLELAVLAILLSLCISLPLGILSARKPNSWIDHFSRLLALAGAAVPTFWLSLILVFLLSVTVQWLPSLGWVPLSEGIGDNLLHLIIPVFALSLPLSAMESRMLRGEMLEVLSQVYIQVARAKGMRQRAVLMRHALRNAVLPVVTIIGLQMGALLGGAVIVESIFSLPGMGQLVFNSIVQRDYSVLNGCVLFMGGTILLTNLVVDVLYAFLDPRIRYS